MPAIETGVEPVHLTLPSGVVLTLHAAYPDGLAADDDDPFYLPPPEPVFAPLAMETERGPAALLFMTRQRAVAEGPRRTSLAETVTLATGGFLDRIRVDGMEQVDAPAWNIPAPGGLVPASVFVECSFPWASPSGRRTDLNIEYRREDGRGGAPMMSTETMKANQDALAEAFHGFLAANPGLANMAEKGLAAMDARVMRFEADRIERVAREQAARIADARERSEMEADCHTQAMHLREGAEVIEENLDPEEPTNGFVR